MAIISWHGSKARGILVGYNNKGDVASVRRTNCGKWELRKYVPDSELPVSIRAFGGALGFIAAKAAANNHLRGVSYGEV